MAWWRNSDPEPQDLSEEEFTALAGRLVDVAVRGATVSDAITATAKALGTLISVASKHPEVSFDQMLEVASGAVEQYARTAFGEEQNEAAPSTTKKLQKASSSFIDIIATDTKPSEIQGAAIALSSIAGLMVGFASVRGDGGNMRPQELLESCLESFRRQANKHRQTMLGGH
jgi:hypothetical protein